VLDEKWNAARLPRTVSIVLLIRGGAGSQEPTRKTDAAVERIVGAAITRGGAMAFLKTLTDTIGGRLVAGSVRIDLESAEGSGVRRRSY